MYEKETVIKGEEPPKVLYIKATPILYYTYEYLL